MLGTSLARHLAVDKLMIFPGHGNSEVGIVQTGNTVMMQRNHDGAKLILMASLTLVCVLKLVCGHTGAAGQVSSTWNV